MTTAEKLLTAGQTAKLAVSLFSTLVEAWTGGDIKVDDLIDSVIEELERIKDMRARIAEKQAQQRASLDDNAS
jgi:hypothetical protein